MLRFMAVLPIGCKTGAMISIIMSMVKDGRRKMDDVLCLFLPTWKLEVFPEAPSYPFSRCLLISHSRTSHRTNPTACEAGKASTFQSNLYGGEGMPRETKALRVALGCPLNRVFHRQFFSL